MSIVNQVPGLDQTGKDLAKHFESRINQMTIDYLDSCNLADIEFAKAMLAATFVLADQTAKVAAVARFDDRILAAAFNKILTHRVKDVGNLFSKKEQSK